MATGLHPWCSLPPTLTLPLGGGKVWKNFLLVVTPVKTGVQAVLKDLKILDSGLRRNDGKKPQANFFTPSGRGSCEKIM